MKESKENFEILSGNSVDVVFFSKIWKNVNNHFSKMRRLFQNNSRAYLETSNFLFRNYQKIWKIGRLVPQPEFFFRSIPYASTWVQRIKQIRKFRRNRMQDATRCLVNTNLKPPEIRKLTFCRYYFFNKNISNLRI